MDISLLSQAKLRYHGGTMVHFKRSLKRWALTCAVAVWVQVPCPGAETSVATTPAAVLYQPQGFERQKLLEVARAYQEELETWASEVSGTLVGPRIKSEHRVLLKAHKDYAGDRSRVLDLVAASVLFPHEAELYQAYGRLSEFFSVVRCKDRFARPAPTGYQDIQCILEHSGMYVELQLHTTHLHQVYMQSHHIYEEFQREWRRVERLSSLGVRSPHEEQKLQELRQGLQKHHDSLGSRQVTPPGGY